MSRIDSSLNAEAIPPPENVWQPDLAEPKVAVYGLEDLSLAFQWAGHKAMEDYLRDFGTNLSRELLARTTEIAFPATDSTTLVDESDKESTFFPMRYVPDLFKDIKTPEIFKLAEIYKNLLPIVIHAELGEEVNPINSNARSAESFVIDAAKGELLDPHTDERMTVVFYPNSGQGLIVSHCTNARSFDDIQANPVTFVLPGAASFVVFDGVRHPHIGISLGLSIDDPKDERLHRLNEVYRQFRVAGINSNLTEEVIFEGERRQVINDEYLCVNQDIGGDRVVISMNFDSSGNQLPDIQRTPLDNLFQDAVSSSAHKK